MTAVFFTAGVTNVMLGLVGVYVGNLFEQSKRRPIYVVAQTTALGQEIGCSAPIAPTFEVK